MGKISEYTDLINIYFRVQNGSCPGYNAKIHPAARPVNIS